MLHPELERLLMAVDAVEADARNLVQVLSDEQGNWRPNGGAGWSVAQCFDHLARINVFYVRHFIPFLEQAQREGKGPFTGLHPTWFGRTFLKVLEPPVRQRGKAPANVAPCSTMPLAEALGDYLSSHEPYRGMLRLANEIDVDRVVAPNPFFKSFQMRAATALKVIPAHDRRHLWQARRVLQAPGFPA